MKLFAALRTSISCCHQIVLELAKDGVGQTAREADRSFFMFYITITALFLEAYFILATDRGVNTRHKYWKPPDPTAAVMSLETRLCHHHLQNPLTHLIVSLPASPEHGRDETHVIKRKEELVTSALSLSQDLASRRDLAVCCPFRVHKNCWLLCNRSRLPWLVKCCRELCLALSHRTSHFRTTALRLTQSWRAWSSFAQREEHANTVPADNQTILDGFRLEISIA